MKSKTLKEGQQLDQLQRRGSPRIRLQVPVFLRGADASGAEFVELTKTLNICATGACITSTHVLRPDQIVYLTVPAPSPISSSLVLMASWLIGSSLQPKTRPHHERQFLHISLSISFGAMRSAAKMSTAALSVAAALGMPYTALVASSCAIV